jgi:hypothetical protein
MADYPPFMNSYGLIAKILTKIKEAKTPDRFTQDYLATTLGFSSGSAKPFIPFAKRLGLLSSDGSPTDLYHQFRNPNQSRGAMARAMRFGYADLFARNENIYRLDKKGLEGIVVQATGLDTGSGTLRSIVASFESLKSFADFEQQAPPATGKQEPGETGSDFPVREGLRLGLSYTINLVLPKTDDLTVYSAIFRALRENLLQQ